MTSDQMINKVGGNIQEKAALIWNVANTLVGLYKPHEYGLVILPMCIIKRFHDCLLPTHEKVLETYEKIKTLEVKDGFLSKASGYQFYNTSKFTFETLVADPLNIADNFEDYINGFSDNVKDILHRMKFEDQIKTMKEGKVLYQVISDFNSAKADMNPEKISAIDMGYIFENLVQRFSESYDEEAGAHFTSRDIIYTMCDLLVSGDKNAFSSDGINKTVYDMTMGTSQMLTCMEERLRQFDKDAVVTSFGQEFNPFTFGIAKADMLIRGGDPDNMQFGDTLNDDKFSGYTFDYIISNPPFGIDWKKEASDIEKESKLGAKGRFGAGLPPKSDGQLLFMLNGVAKLKETGRMAIIQNGSSLFSGDAGSGQSEIRRYLIENDWLDAIIQLPNDSFYNTGIATYIWIVTKNKDEKRLGRVQLIDASNCYESRRKNIGNKRVDLTTDCRNLILRAYDEYSDKDYEEKTENGNSIICKSKVLDSVDLGYNKITVESPLLDENGETVKDKKGKTQSDSNKRDYENVPLDEDIDKYFEREVLPYNKAAWIDKSKTKVGYEIPFTRTFYVYKQLEKADEIASRIEWHEKSLMEKLRKLFGED
ncbi:class I SAM-dependent DNA methyltransferase [Treponema succinifaciens]|uniref:type I restriction-modification system subunit M n=1 Tax=Treponema succinifaciens TaxID=167 RepID=UPI0023F444C5|nr:class I SAM-dependent DNA methyltransferase [Treponema succinifaciens]